MNVEPVYTSNDWETYTTRVTLLETICDKVSDLYKNIENFDYASNKRKFYTGTSKVYIRVHKPTKKWYIGSTTQRYAIFRHHQDILSACLHQNKKRSPLYEFYKSLFVDRNLLSDLFNKYIDDPNYIFDDDWAICTVAQFTNDKKLVNNVETSLIHTLTTPNRDQILPMILCLNAYETYKKPQKTGKQKTFDTKKNDMISPLLSTIIKSV
jgi:hypothetical protein